MEISFSQTPTTDELKNYITTIEKVILKDLREFWKDWALPLVTEEIARIFATEGYGTWQRLEPAYAARKAKRYPRKTILRREDNYFKAATRPNEPGNVSKFEKDWMEWGIDLGYFTSTYGFPYPVVHETGGVNMPRRPVFEMAEESDALQNNLVKGFADYLDKRIRKESERVFK